MVGLIVIFMVIVFGKYFNWFYFDLAGHRRNLNGFGTNLILLLGDKVTSKAAVLTLISIWTTVQILFVAIVLLLCISRLNYR